jgi:hypothetical protein
MSERPILAAELLRRRTEKSANNAPASEQPDVDIDDEIKRLEAELENSDDSSQYSRSSDDSGTNDRKVLNLSSVETERIGKLPKHLLPSSKKRSLKGIDRPMEPSKRKKAVESKDGLRAAVKELLDGYKPRSAERLPFYCRACAKQYTSEQEFVEHQKSEFHITAVEVERKASYCKLCRKQLTSPAQLKEHLMSKPHKNRLSLLQSKQPHRRDNNQSTSRNQHHRPTTAPPKI